MNDTCRHPQTPCPSCNLIVFYVVLLTCPRPWRFSVVSESPVLCCSLAEWNIQQRMENGIVKPEE
jgi:hypothetical protein